MLHGYCKRLMWVLTCMICLPVFAWAQKGSITGKVLDAKGEPIIGALVVLEGTTKGSATDLDGNFRIKDLPAGKVKLQISALGLAKETRTVTVEDGKEMVLNLSLKEEAVNLKEAVVIGYGMERKRDVTGAISTLKAKDMNLAVSPSIDQALQGRATGVQMTAASGVAGAPVKINVRGTNSITGGSQPLFVVDGIPITTGDFSPGNLGSGTNALSDLNPSDIESINILRDAAACAIYGSRGANGVVLITTKKGKSGKTRFDFGYSYGTVTPTNRLKFLDAAQHLALRDRAAAEDSSVFRNDRANTQLGVWNGKAFTRSMADSLLGAGYYNNNDWIGATLRQGMVQTANLSAAGGSDRTTFYISGSYYDQKGFLVGNDYKRFNNKIDIDNQALDNLRIGLSNQFSFTLNERVPIGDAGGLGLAQQRLPYIPIYNTDGTLNDPFNNPVWQLQNRKFSQNVYRNISNVYAELTLMPYLKVRSSFGLDLLNQVEYEFNRRNTQDSTSVSDAWDRRTNVVNWVNTNYMTFDKSLDSIHRLTVTAGAEFQRLRSEGLGLHGIGFANDFYTRPGNAITKGQDSYNYITGSGFVSYFARAGYKLKDRYFLNASLRFDASSRFAPGRQYGAFPAVSAGWLISDEAFLRDNKTISYLKVRAGYGLTGNNNIGDASWVGFFGSNNGYLGNPGIVPANLGNTRLGWEQSSSVDAGLELGLFNNRISLTADIYRRVSVDLLLNQYLPTSSGYSAILSNLGKIENRGLELSLTTRNLTGEFTWTTDFNIAFNRNKALELNNQPPDNFDSAPGEGRCIVGYPVGQFYVVRFSRVAAADGSVVVRDDNLNPILDGSGNVRTLAYKAGTAIYLDKNGNDMIFNDAGFFYNQRVPRGNPLPRFIGGINNSFTYKGFDLSFLFSFVVGNQIYDDPAKQQIGNWQALAQRPEILEAWNPSNPNSVVPGLTRYNAAVNSDRFLYDASFLRLRSLNFGYTLPEAVTKKMKLSKLRIYISGGNLLTFTNYPGWDPEALRNVNPNSQQGNISFGGPSFQTPQSRTVMVGINIGF